jgi:hypothetical protein
MDRKLNEVNPMAKYTKLPITIEAHQWFKNGDHPEDDCYMVKPDPTIWAEGEREPFLSEGKVVRYYRHPNVDGAVDCHHCGKPMHDHGWIDTLEAGHNVCPGDFIITGVKGELYPCKPDVFELTYEPTLANISTDQDSKTVNPLDRPVCHSLVDILKSLKFGRPVDDQEVLDEFIDYIEA